MRACWEVIEARVLEFPHLFVAFADGTRGSFDFTPYLDLPAFEKLNDPAFFALARVEGGTVAWPQHIDIAPERLHDECVRIEP